MDPNVTMVAVSLSTPEIKSLKSAQLEPLLFEPWITISPDVRVASAVFSLTTIFADVFVLFQ